MLKYHLNQYLVIQDSGSKGKLRKKCFNALNAISTRAKAISKWFWFLKLFLRGFSKINGPLDRTWLWNPCLQSGLNHITSLRIIFSNHWNGCNTTNLTLQYYISAVGKPNKNIEAALKAVSQLRRLRLLNLHVLGDWISEIDLERLSEVQTGFNLQHIQKCKLNICFYY